MTITENRDIKIGPELLREDFFQGVISAEAISDLSNMISSHFRKRRCNFEAG
jgi:hypothetical protein